MPEESVASRIIFGVSLSRQAAEYVQAEAIRRGTVCDMIISELVDRGMANGHTKKTADHRRVGKKK